MSAEQKICPLCGVGHLQPLTEEFVTEYLGQQGTVLLRSKECTECGSELTDHIDGLANKRAVTAFRKRVDGLMSGVDIRQLRKKLGITQDQAARVFGGGEKAFSKYETDDVAQSEAMNNLFLLAEKNPQTFWDLVEIKRLTAEFSNSSPRAARSFEPPRAVLVAESTDPAPYRLSERG